ncbi:helix-turn-helix transcriptional regulator [Actinoallomurus sp. CA-142502]|uniref:helix-turn-helix transcriptional regulator n=1 Tax=Actinoallomurus sp. CA-142502 TaxID=3239885 RepID=UPI003D92758F
MEYELTFVVTGADVDDDGAVWSLMEHADATLHRGAGVDLLTISVDADNAVDATQMAIVECKRHVPELVFLRLDRDLVGVSEIAQRTKRSRQNVSQWISGERHVGLAPFPAPEGVVGRARVWLWGEVNTWLAQLGLNDDLSRPTRDEILEIDYLLSVLEKSKRLRAERALLWSATRVRRGKSFNVGLLNTRKSLSRIHADFTNTGHIVFDIHSLSRVAPKRAVSEEFDAATSASSAVELTEVEQ